MEFTYRVKDKESHLLKGVVEADNKEKAVALLRERGYFVIDVRPGGGLDLKDITLFKKTSQKDVVLFTRQLATMINAGLPLNDALLSLREQVKPAFAQVVDEIFRRVEAGQSLGKSLEGWPDLFDGAYIASVKSGEAAGVLDKVLLRLADEMEEKKKFQGKIKEAMIYPIIVIIAMVAVAAVMMIFVIPKMMSLYTELGAELPLPTRILMGISSLAVRFWWMTLLFLGGLGYGFFALKKTSWGRELFDRLILKMPVIGPLQEKTELTNLTRTLSLLVSTGISLVDALDIVAGVVNNSIFHQAVKEAARGVEKGRSLSQMLAHTGVFPPILYQMVAVGEGTGRMDESLEKVSRYFKEEAEQMVKALTSAIEPFIIVVLGIGVGFLVIAVIMPIYNLTSQF